MKKHILSILSLSFDQIAGGGIEKTRLHKCSFLCIKKWLCSVTKSLFLRVISNKTFVFFAIVATVLALTYILPFFNVQNHNIAYAKSDSQSKEAIEDELEDNIDKALDGIDDSAFDDLIAELDKEQQDAINFKSFKSAVLDMTKSGERNIFEAFYLTTIKMLGKYFAGFLPSLFAIVAICLLKSVLDGMTSNFLNSSTGEIVHFVCYCAIIVILMTGVGDIVAVVTDTTGVMSKFSSITFPVMLALISAVGGIGSSALFSPFVSILASTILQLISKFVLPIFVAIIVFSVVGNISKTVKLDRMTKLIKSGATKFVAVAFGLFASLLTFQGIAGGVIDKFGFSVAKFALSSYVPVLGGYLSDGLDLFTAGMVLTKNAFGLSAVIVLLAVVLFPVLKLIVFQFSVKLIGAIIEPTGDQRVCKMLSLVGDSVSLLVTALAGVAFMFFVLLMIMMSSCNMGI